MRLRATVTDLLYNSHWREGELEQQLQGIQSLEKVDK